MAHLRLRKFNTKDVYPGQKLDNDLSMVVRAGGRAARSKDPFRRSLDPLPE